LRVQTIPSVEANQSTILALTCAAATLPKGRYRLKAFVIPPANESEIADNALTFGYLIITILGDVNGDHFVELSDFFLASQAFGSVPGDPNWNANTDINNDRIVELMDFWIMSEHFGEIW